MSQKKSSQTSYADKLRTLETNGISRRSLLSWLGKATVLGLSSDLLIACAESSSRITSISEGTSLGSYEFPFSPYPDDEDIYKDWPKNTVDVQKIETILSSWELEINGLVDEERTLSFTDLLALPRQDQVVDFHCVEGWSVHDVPWNGVHISKLIELVRPSDEVTHITIHCSRGIYSESLPLEVALEERTMLAYGVGGATLPLDHGFPLRLVIPRMYGYKSAKWVTGLEFTNELKEGFWEKRGYPSDAGVVASRLREGKY